LYLSGFAITNTTLLTNYLPTFAAGVCSPLVTQVMFLSLKSLMITNWRRLCGNSPPIAFSMVAAMLVGFAGLSRLMSILSVLQDIEKESVVVNLQQGFISIVVGAFTAFCTRMQFFPACVAAAYSGSLHVANSEEDLILRSHYGFDYLPLGSASLYAFCKLGMNTSKEKLALSSTLMFFAVLGNIVVDFSVTSSQRHLHRRRASAYPTEGSIETLEDILKRLLQPSGHLAPRFGNQLPPPQVAAISLTPDLPLGILCFGVEDFIGIALASFFMFHGADCIDGVFGWGWG